MMEQVDLAEICSAKTFTRFTGGSIAAISSSTPSMIRASVGSYCWILRTVKKPVSSRRYRVCSGASIRTKLPGADGSGE